MLFRSDWDWKVKILTIAIILIFFFLIWLSYLVFSRTLRMALIIFLLGLIIFSFLISPSGYLIDNKNLYIITRIRKFKIPLLYIKSAKKLDKDELYGSIRILGIGGLFGYTGLFHSKHLGFFFSFATNYDNLIFIESNKKFLISPNNVESFLTSIKKD